MFEGNLECKEYDREAARPCRLPTRKAQADVNERNSKRHVTQLIKTNFDERAAFQTYSYNSRHLPPDDEAAERDLTNFLRRVKDANRRAGGEAFKYIAVTEQGSKSGRYHHHAVIHADALTHEQIAALWRDRKGAAIGLVNTSRLELDKESLEGLAKYMLKDKKNKHRWRGSRNLIQPKRTKPKDDKYTKRAVDRLCKDPARLYDLEYWARRYPGWVVNEVCTRYNEASGWYIYLKLERDRGFDWNNYRDKCRHWEAELADGNITQAEYNQMLAGWYGGVA